MNKKTIVIDMDDVHYVQNNWLRPAPSLPTWIDDLCSRYL